MRSKPVNHRRSQFARPALRVALVGSAGAAVLVSCKSPEAYRKEADKEAYAIIQQKQLQAEGEAEPFTIERPADTLRKRLMLDQKLMFSDPASLGTSFITPIPEWPKDRYLVEPPPGVDIPLIIPPENEPLRLSLTEALEVAAKNSREYQDRKEQVFQTALDLDLERHFYEFTWSGVLGAGATADLLPNNDVVGVDAGATGGVTKRFRNGAALTSRIGIDIVKLLTQGGNTSTGVFGDASIAIPLLRGSGAFVASEPLTQAERNALYAILEFERFKTVFAVDIANDYLNVISARDRVQNAELNYARSILSARRAQRLREAGEQAEYQVAQAVQRELRARTRWVSAQASYADNLDNFKTALGLPPDARIAVDREELQRLRQDVEDVLERIRAAPPATEAVAGDVPAADAEIVVRPPSRSYAGEYELEEERAVGLALSNRRDLYVAQGQVYDAQRGVAIAADALRAELTLLGSAVAGEPRNFGSAAEDDSYSLSLDRATYDALLTLDLPLDRVEERNRYRDSLILLEQRVRDLQALEDQVKAQVRGTLRDMEESREAVRIQSESVALAERTVRVTEQFLEAGRGSTQIRDVLEAQDALVTAQDALTSALVTYRVSELRLQRDLGLLEVDPNGQWKEFDPNLTVRTEESEDGSS